MACGQKEAHVRHIAAHNDIRCVFKAAAIDVDGKPAASQSVQRCPKRARKAVRGSARADRFAHRKREELGDA